jgi:hypothetical protein
MMRQVWQRVLAVCLLASVSGGQVLAQQGPEVLAEHRVLHQDEGTWNAEMKIWAAGPDAEPVVTKGKEVNTLVLNGLWVASQFEADFFGQKFAGSGTIGYDAIKKKYVGTWIDTMTPGLTMMEGEFDKAKGELVMVSKMYDPSAGKELPSKNVVKYDGKNRRVMTMYSKPDGQDEFVKAMEIVYTRQ